jgi:hypothetical protein
MELYITTGAQGTPAIAFSHGSLLALHLLGMTWSLCMLALSMLGCVADAHLLLKHFSFSPT